MTKIKRLWMQLRAMPAIVQLGMLIAALILTLLAWPASAQQFPQAAPAQVYCRDGRPVALTVILSEPGVFSIEFPPDLCAPSRAQPPAAQPRPPASAQRAARPSI